MEANKRGRMKLFALITLIFVSVSAFAQRSISGTVYNNGQPAAGVTVTIHKGGDVFTGFDGKFKFDANEKAKWIKAVMPTGEELKMDILTEDVIDFVFGSTPVTTVDPTVDPNAETQGCKPQYGADSIECLKNLSLYREFYKQESYDNALIGWRYVFNNCPGASKNTFLHGVSMMSEKYKTASDADKKAYVDTIVMIYDKRMECFGEKGDVLGRKGLTLFIMDDSRNEEAYKFLREGIDILKDKTNEVVLHNYVQASLVMFKAGKIDAGKVVDDFGLVMGYLDQQINSATTAADKDKIEKVKASTESAFVSSDAATCDALIAFYSPMFDQKKGDAVFLNKAITILDKLDCEGYELYEKLVVQSYKTSPTAEAAYNLARFYYWKEKYTEAIDYYKKAIDQETDNDKKATYCIELAKVYNSKLKNGPSARSYAQQAISLRANWGEPYLIIASAYGSSSAACRNSDNVDDRAVFWAAVDKCVQAKSIDPSVTDQANAMIASYAANYPKQEDVFFFGYVDGQAYTIGCWIQESTTVRTIK